MVFYFTIYTVLLFSHTSDQSSAIHIAGQLPRLHTFSEIGLFPRHSPSSSVTSSSRVILCLQMTVRVFLPPPHVWLQRLQLPTIQLKELKWVHCKTCLLGKLNKHVQTHFASTCTWYNSHMNQIFTSIKQYILLTVIFKQTFSIDISTVLLNTLFSAIR